MKNYFVLALVLSYCLVSLAQSEPKPRLWVLSVGITTYKDARLNLSFAHSDAHSVAESIEKKANLSGNYASCTVKEITNEAATKANIQQTLTAWRKEMKQNDHLIVFYAGHSAITDNKEYLLLYDGAKENMKSTGITKEDIVDNNPASTIFLYDGNFEETGRAEITENQNLTATKMILYSASKSEFSFEKPSWGQSAFGKAILEGIKGNADYNKDGRIYCQELNQYVAARTIELTKGKQHPCASVVANIPLF